MAMKRSYSGATCAVKENLTSGAGAFFKNFDINTDLARLADSEQYMQLLTEKGIGATQGGGNFTATPVTRQIAIDGIDPITVYDGWTVTMTANVIEFVGKTIQMALGSGVVENAPGTLTTRYKTIQANRAVSSTDYIENITWIVSKVGYVDPLIIQIYNAISTTGININIADTANNPIVITFTSMVDVCKNPEMADKAPFAIYDPLVKLALAPVEP